jgi:hypothetical protein
MSRRRDEFEPPRRQPPVVLDFFRAALHLALVERPEKRSLSTSSWQASDICSTPISIKATRRNERCDESNFVVTACSISLFPSIHAMEQLVLARRESLKAYLGFIVPFCKFDGEYSS